MMTTAPSTKSALQPAGWKDKEEGGKHVHKNIYVRMFSVKNYEGSEVLPNMEANK